MTGILGALAKYDEHVAALIKSAQESTVERFLTVDEAKGFITKYQQVRSGIAILRAGIDRLSESELDALNSGELPKPAKEKKRPPLVTGSDLPHSGAKQHEHESGKATGGSHGGGASHASKPGSAGGHSHK